MFSESLLLFDGILFGVFASTFIKLIYNFLFVLSGSVINVTITLETFLFNVLKIFNNTGACGRL